MIQILVIIVKNNIFLKHKIDFAQMIISEFTIGLDQAMSLNRKTDEKQLKIQRTALNELKSNEFQSLFQSVSSYGKSYIK